MFVELLLKVQFMEKLNRCQGHKLIKKEEISFNDMSGSFQNLEPNSKILDIRVQQGLP